MEVVFSQKGRMGRVVAGGLYCPEGSLIKGWMWGSGMLSWGLDQERAVEEERLGAEW